LYFESVIQVTVKPVVMSYSFAILDICNTVLYSLYITGVVAILLSLNRIAKFRKHNQLVYVVHVCRLIPFLFLYWPCLRVDSDDGGCR